MIPLSHENHFLEGNADSATPETTAGFLPGRISLNGLLKNLLDFILGWNSPRNNTLPSTANAGSRVPPLRQIAWHPSFFQRSVQMEFLHGLLRHIRQCSALGASRSVNDNVVHGIIDLDLKNIKCLCRNQKKLEYHVLISAEWDFPSNSLIPGEGTDNTGNNYTFFPAVHKRAHDCSSTHSSGWKSWTYRARNLFAVRRRSVPIQSISTIIKRRDAPMP